jgi:hypothetical protein
MCSRGSSSADLPVVLTRARPFSRTSPLLTPSPSASESERSDPAPRPRPPLMSPSDAPEDRSELGAACPSPPPPPVAETRTICLSVWYSRRCSSEQNRCGRRFLFVQPGHITLHTTLSLPQKPQLDRPTPPLGIVGVGWTECWTECWMDRSAAGAPLSRQVGR